MVDATSERYHANFRKKMKIPPHLGTILTLGVACYKDVPCLGKNNFYVPRSLIFFEWNGDRPHCVILSCINIKWLVSNRPMSILPTCPFLHFPHKTGIKLKKQRVVCPNRGPTWTYAVGILKKSWLVLELWWYKILTDIHTDIHTYIHTYIQTDTRN